MRRFLPILCSIVTLSLPVHSQKFEWNTGLDAFLDTREYYTLHIPQTMFGARLRAEAGGLMNDVHRLRAGINYLYEFGSAIDAYKPNLTLYYEYHD